MPLQDLFSLDALVNVRLTYSRELNKVKQYALLLTALNVVGTERDEWPMVW